MKMASHMSQVWSQPIFFIVYIENLNSGKIINGINVFSKDSLKISWHKEKVTCKTSAEKCKAKYVMCVA